MALSFLDRIALVAIFVGYVLAGVLDDPCAGANPAQSKSAFSMNAGTADLEIVIRRLFCSQWV